MAASLLRTEICNSLMMTNKVAYSRINILEGLFPPLLNSLPIKFLAVPLLSEVRLAVIRDRTFSVVATCLGTLRLRNVVCL